MKNGDLRFMIPGLVLLISFISVGCGYTEEEYMAKVKEANESQRLAKQRQTQMKASDKQVKELQGELKSIKEELSIIQVEKKRAQAQQETNKEHLEVAKTRLKEEQEALQTIKVNLANMKNELGNVSEELAQTKSQVTSKEKELENQEEQLQNKQHELEGTQKQLRATEVQLTNIKNKLEDTMKLNKKLEKSVSDSFLQIRNLEQREQELQAKYSNFQDREKELLAQIETVRSELFERDERLRKEREVQQQLLTTLKEQLESDKIKISELSNRVAVRLDERLLFDSGKAFIKASGFKILNKIGSVLKKIEDKHIQVEGHTDNRPIGSVLKRKFATNWELSAARATSVTRYLVDVVKISPNRISATGFSSHQPIADNKTAEGRQSNRRVEFALLPLRLNENE